MVWRGFLAWGGENFFFGQPFFRPLFNKYLTCVTLRAASRAQGAAVTGVQTWLRKAAGPDFDSPKAREPGSLFFVLLAGKCLHWS